MDNYYPDACVRDVAFALCGMSSRQMKTKVSIDR